MMTKEQVYEIAEDFVNENNPEKWQGDDYETPKSFKGYCEKAYKTCDEMFILTIEYKFDDEGLEGYKWYHCCCLCLYSPHNPIDAIDGYGITNPADIAETIMTLLYGCELTDSYSYCFDRQKAKDN